MMMMMMITAKMNMLGNDSNDIPDRARSGGWWTLLGNPTTLECSTTPTLCLVLAVIMIRSIINPHHHHPVLSNPTHNGHDV